MALIGLFIVIGCVGGGFILAGGHVAILLQPAEFVVIVGAAVGSLIASAPGKMRGRVLHVLKSSFKDIIPKKSDYLDLLKCQYQLFMLARRQGVLALESHAAEPSKSNIFRKYPSVIKSAVGMQFLADALQQMVNGTSVDDLDQLLESEIDTFKAEGHMGTGLLKVVGDSLPGIGIVAAVLGIIVTMGHMDAAPAVIGLHVASALVGTFLGILLCYGIVAPLANNAEFQEAHVARYLEVIRAVVLAVMRGSAPAVAIEFGRKMVFPDERPSAADTDKALASVKN